ncbi:4-oxalomesaconate tautomerase [Devosia sp. FKR38]|uniref:4-oxalomesaconate tautomerase n=1 Tax=Devosia sp. FKR38 TaxID=2562312 RepID=UPI00148557CB|nr:4-oxalomesaconate tautomerase [Devosia sp. FKR38]
MQDDLVRIPCVMMRGGTSKGPFFLASDLPADPAERNAVLVEIMGSGHPLQIDGIGGGNTLSSKVAIVGPSTRSDADVDYLFAQVRVDMAEVDTAPNCGNMLSAVAPFAISAGLVVASDGETRVKVHNVNTGKIIEARILTPRGEVRYQGDASIDGVPGDAAPVYLAFHDAVGAKTGRLLPTDAVSETIHGRRATLIDGATSAVVLLAEDFGLTGSETARELDGNADLMRQLEAIRLEAGLRMGFGDVANSVLPKPILIGRPGRGGDLAIRYFTPHTCHTSLATTGAVTIAMAATVAGTVVARSLNNWSAPAELTFEHPTGRMTVRVEHQALGNVPVVYVMRTCRRLFEGSALIRRKA